MVYRHQLAILLAFAAPFVASQAAAAPGTSRLDVTRDTSPETVTPEPAERLAERVGVHTGGGVLFGLLPSPVVAAFAGVDVAILDRMIVSVSAMLSGHTRSQLVTGRFEAQLVAGRAAMCHRAQAGGGVTLNFCTGAAVGRYLARGYGYLTNRRANLPWTAGFSHTGLRVLDGPVKLELGVEGYVNVIRPRLTVEGAIDDPLTMPFIAWSSMLELLFVF